MRSSPGTVPPAGTPRAASPQTETSWLTTLWSHLFLFTKFSPLYLFSVCPHNSLSECQINLLVQYLCRSFFFFFCSLKWQFELEPIVPGVLKVIQMKSTFIPDGTLCVTNSNSSHKVHLHLEGTWLLHSCPLTPSCVLLTVLDAP